MLFHWDSSDIFHINKHKQSSEITCKSWLLAQWCKISDCQSLFFTSSAFVGLSVQTSEPSSLYFSDFSVSFSSKQTLKCVFTAAPCFHREDFDQEEKARFGELCSGENGKGREWFAKYVSAQVSPEKIKHSLVIPIILYKHQPNNGRSFPALFSSKHRNSKHLIRKHTLAHQDC